MYLKLIVAGHLGQTPELRYTPAGKAVANLSLASNRNWTDGSGNKVSEVTWIRVTVWGRMAEVAAQYLEKGRSILVEGYLNPDANGNPRIWTAQDGTPRASFEMTAREVRFLGGNGNGNGGQAVSEAPESITEELGEQDEIPF